jgi:hypothetical protein
MRNADKLSAAAIPPMAGVEAKSGVKLQRLLGLDDPDFYPAVLVSPLFGGIGDLWYCASMTNRFNAGFFNPFTDEITAHGLCPGK